MQLKSKTSAQTFGTRSVLRSRSVTVRPRDSHIQGGPKNWHIFVRLITSSNTDDFSNFFHCQNQEKMSNNTIYH